MTEENIEAATENETTINEQPDERSDDKKHNFKDGQILRFIRVRFPGHAKSYPFMIGRRNYTYGQRVIALSDRGMATGYINSFPYDVEFNESLLPVRTISRIANEEDQNLKEDSLTREKEYEDLCKDLIKKHELAMNLTHVELTGHGKKAVFYFTAPERVDFRGLVKDLVSNLRMRIELRQISARERSAALGGLGPCGRAFCCSTFLSRYGNVNIKMARTQNLTLIPSKLNGLCGQLKCCIAYEEEVYQEKRSNLPEEGTIIRAQNGDIGKINKLHIIKEQFDMITESGVIRRYTADQFDKDNNLPENYRFPREFQNISFETDIVIGEKVSTPVSYDDFFEDDSDDSDDSDDNENEVEDTDETDGTSETEDKELKNTQEDEDSDQKEQRPNNRKRNKNNPFNRKKHKKNDSQESEGESRNSNNRSRRPRNRKFSKGNGKPKKDDA